MKFPLLPWIILLLPLAAAAAITLITRTNPRRSAALSIGAVLAALGSSVALIAANGWDLQAETAFRWLDIGGLQADIGLRLDALSLMMLLVVTGVGGLIHIYSWGYMSDDPGFARFFACLSLFTFSMLGIVLAANFLMMFVFWELVGLSSYLLIGFWYDRPAAADACKKAFLVNRIGDFGFLLGILMVWTGLGSLHFTVLQDTLKQSPEALGSLATAAGLLIFCGAMGKSAQFPLHVWLPDAMEGPTPVSALIHAATMVAAGVYMLCRVFFMLDLPGSQALDVITWIGAFTALLAALIAVQQDDIKRILAYSTLSQLGYMVMAVGVSHANTAMFHLTTHAFFKALLFLGAGSVIHALHHEQNIWRMGGLVRRMPVTFWTFLIATLALCGVPPMSGFFSKDEILLATLQAPHGSRILFVLATSIAVLTTLYMFRLLFVAFLGPARGDATAHAHESPKVMTLPLLALAVPAALAGFWGIPGIYARQLGETHFESHAIGAAAGIVAVTLGFAAAWLLYRKADRDPLPDRLGALGQAMRQRFYFDEFYAATAVRFQDGLAAVADWIDRWLIAGAGVRGVHGTVEFAGRALRLMQTGNVQTYALWIVAGLALMLWMVLR